MSLLLALLAGAMFGLGILVAWRAWIGWSDKPSQKRVEVKERVYAGGWAGWVFLALVLAGIGYLVTGWVSFAVGVGATSFLIRYSVVSKRESKAMIDTAHALASWVESMSSVMRTHSGLNESIATTSAYVSPLIARDVQVLSADAQSQPLVVALANFAKRLDHPASDNIAMALIVADSRQTTDLSGLLSEMALLTQRSADFLSEISASRSRIFAEARAIVGLTLFMSLLLLLFGQELLEAYDNIFGEIVLTLVLGLYLAAGWLLIKLNRPPSLPRALTFSRIEGL